MLNRPRPTQGCRVNRRRREEEEEEEEEEKKKKKKKKRRRTLRYGRQLEEHLEKK